MDPTAQIEKILKDHGRSVTRQRLMVFSVLQESKQPMSTVELTNKLPSLDKVSVYRTVDLYEKIGLVHRVWHGFKSKIELSEAFSPHHHHFTCTVCGNIIALKSETLETELHKFEAEHGFELKYHSVELSGHCQECRTKKHAQSVD